jgi:hypothetical protein
MSEIWVIRRTSFNEIWISYPDGVRGLFLKEKATIAFNPWVGSSEGVLLPAGIYFAIVLEFPIE